MEYFDFNNRDLVSIIFVILVFVLSMLKKEVRASIFSLLKFAFQPKIILPILLMLVYTLMVVLVFRHFQLWDISLLKDTAYWLGAAFVMLLNFEKVSNDFKRHIADSVKWVVVLEFLAGLYVFSVWGEIILIPLVFMLFAFSIIAGTKKESQPIKRFSDKALSAIGLYLLFFVLWSIAHDFKGFLTLHNLESFLLPIVFTLCYLPFIYLVAIYGAYDSLFTLMDKVWLKGKSVLANIAKREIFFMCLLNLKKIKHISSRSPFAFMDINNKNDLSKKLLKLMN